MLLKHIHLTRWLQALGIALAALSMATDLYAQKSTVYKCTNASGVVVFSDKACMGPTTIKNVKTSGDDADMQQRKSESDARISRNTTLANQVQASRISREQAGRAAQDQQVQSTKAVGNRMEQERTQRNAATVSDPGVSQSAPTKIYP